MKDEELKFDHTCHVLNSKSCKKLIQDKIALHYPQELREEIWTLIHKQYLDQYEYNVFIYNITPLILLRKLIIRNLNKYAS